MCGLLSNKKFNKSKKIVSRSNKDLDLWKVRYIVWMSKRVLSWPSNIRWKGIDINLISRNIDIFFQKRD